MWFLLTHVADVVGRAQTTSSTSTTTPASVPRPFCRTLVLTLAAACFIGLLADLVSVLRKADGDDGPLPTVARSSGISFLVLTLAAASTFVVLPDLFACDEVSDQVDPDIACVTLRLGYLLPFVAPKTPRSGWSPPLAQHAVPDGQQVENPQHLVPPQDSNCPRSCSRCHRP